MKVFDNTIYQKTLGEPLQMLIHPRVHCLTPFYVACTLVRAQVEYDIIIDEERL